MTLPAVLLLIVSAITHASWNLLGKRRHSTAASFLVASAIGLVILLPFPLIFGHIIGGFSSSVWFYIVLTGAFQAVYYISLAAAYRRGDMSLIYPLARSVPAIFVALFALFAGRGGEITAQALGGIGLIVAGGFFLPMKHFTDLSLRKYVNIAFGCVLIAALGTTGYSIVDDTALRLAWSDISNTVPTWQVSAVYAFFEGFSSVLWMIVYIALIPSKRKELGELIARNGASIRGAALMGVGIYATYSLVLVSMAFVREVSYVVAFRQLSIPIGVVFGIVFLKEKMYAPKLLGTLLMFAGLVLVGTG